MTREEQKTVREAKKALTAALRPSGKQHGFKSIGGFLYRAVGEYLYTIILSVPPIDKGEMVAATLYCKPLALDDTFWEVFEMAETARKQPFSFHIQGAFVPYSLALEKWKEALPSVEAMEQTLDLLLLQANKHMEQYGAKLSTIQDFMETISGLQHQRLNYILCEIAVGKFASALVHAEEELAQGNTGGFATTSKNIMQYVVDYCRKRL